MSTQRPRTMGEQLVASTLVSNGLYSYNSKSEFFIDLIGGNLDLLVEENKRMRSALERIRELASTSFSFAQYADINQLATEALKETT